MAVNGLVMGQNRQLLGDKIGFKFGIFILNKYSQDFGQNITHAVDACMRFLPSSVQLAIAVATEVALQSLFPTTSTRKVSLRQARNLIYSMQPYCDI